MSSLFQSTAISANGIRRLRASPGLWAGRARARMEDQPIAVAGALTICAAFVFMAFPGMDLVVSRWAASAAGDFPLSREPALRALRDINRILPYFILPCVLFLLVVQAVTLRPRLLRPHKALFFLTFYALGPGLLIQALKRLVGRARPYDITDFGGSLPFTPAWQVSSACSRSCSFASGESATAIALVALALLLPVHWRRATIIAVIPLILAFSLNRIVFGAHFLSDVVLAWLMMLWLMTWLWPIFTDNGERIDAAVQRLGRRRTR
ncbi:phosphatase PAP2 family protein [Ensifer adhaerens]|uniref:phosphatase PAP2 family protein n=1 Tax=Ensifer adhaerens TaxID=106592 RepID=UPI001CBE3981|nr:phosphatase PAP2 family protein [Ensifer adhaerens]MBZ7925188.1 phosphatase PAP2 family protein [Ensifer adhaerens]UAX95629.1 phosphatase PAP2 family protein [Ensifer adhaerens]UAY02479.1 phosphatase PAP2 family protein [Ensifer adhaerens]UAY10463.1 phosphatase PAP2 family protein [Ensifer adhaerens]